MPPPAATIIPSDPGDREARERAVGAFAALARSGKPLLVFVTHARGGGVARHVRELAALVAEEAAVLVLRSHRRSYVALQGEGEFQDAKLWFHAADDWTGLVQLLRALGATRLHYHHVQGLPRQVLGLASEVGCPWDVTLHDYYPICPQYQLTDASGRYCGEPDEDGCARCLAAQAPQWPVSIREWRAGFERLLRDAARVIAPSQDCADRITRHVPGLAPLVWPHWDVAAAAPAQVKVLVLGGVSLAKGMGLVEACARDARARGLPLRFRVIGHVAHPLAGEVEQHLSFTGEYPEGTLATRIEQERGDVILFPAQWPETHSYTLSDAIAAGLPLVTTDLGAFPERLRSLERARIVPWNIAAERCNDLLLELAGPRAATAALPTPADKEAEDYRARYLAPLPAGKSREPPTIAPPGLATAPDERMPQATLAELFDDGVLAGNGRSSAELRARLPLADRATEHAANLEARVTALREELARVQEQERALKEGLADCRTQVERVQSEAAAARARAAEFEASTSWRLTAPLRALARLLRR